MKTQWAQGEPLPADARARLAALAERVGESELVRLLGVGSKTLARAIAGFGVRKMTATAIRLRLNEIDRET